MPYKDPIKQKLAQHESYEKNKEQVYNRMKQRREERKIWFQNLKKSKSCVVCQESTPICLDFHHIDPSKKFDGLTNMLTNLRSLKSILEEIDKCVVLCSNCHRKFHAGLLIIPT